MNIEYGTPNLLPSETIEIQKYPLKVSLSVLFIHIALVYCTLEYCGL